MLLDLSYLQLLAVAIITFCAATVQASVGIGFAMIAVPLLALIDTSFIPGATLLASLVLVILIAKDGHEHISYSSLPSSLAGIVLGSVLGGGGLLYIASEHLPQLFGALILIAVVLSLLGLSLQNTSKARLLVGLASGVMGTMSGIHGPPFALLYQNEGKTVLPTLSLLFTISYSISLLTLWVVQQLNGETLVLGLLLIPGVLLGFFTAKTVSAKMNKTLLKWGILTVAGCSGLLLVTRA